MCANVPMVNEVMAAWKFPFNEPSSCELSLRCSCKRGVFLSCLFFLLVSLREQNPQNVHGSPTARTLDGLPHAFRHAWRKVLRSSKECTRLQNTVIQFWKFTKRLCRMSFRTSCFSPSRVAVRVAIELEALR